MTSMTIKTLVAAKTNWQCVITLLALLLLLLANPLQAAPGGGKGGGKYGGGIGGSGVQPELHLKWTFEQNPRAFVFQDVSVGPDGHIYGIGTSGMGVFSLAVISGAVVDAVWKLPDGSTIAQTATTGGSGSAKFTVSDGEGLYRLTVTDITLTGYTFDPVHSILEGFWYGF